MVAPAALLDAGNPMGPEVGLATLEEWSDERPWIDDWAALDLVRRKAHFHLLEGVPEQTWDLRFRSTAPGSPIIHREYGRFFPEEDLLFAYDEAMGRHHEYYVYACEPSWRLAWIYR